MTLHSREIQMAKRVTAIEAGTYDPYEELAALYRVEDPYPIDEFSGAFV